MPQISKVRIVNFNYNDGNRLIADELYDFSSIEREAALNVLINLANGGGKSVLVQLMLQPIVPKAKVAGRRIESFFNKPSDHCFVLLEWIKDNSNEKLLTGIAMSTREAFASEDESARGKSVKYYTFYSNYVSYNTQYNIVNLPLSRKENGKFIPADYDTVRTLARKSNGLLNYYVSDDSIKWQKKLEEYGLSQSEWHMIEKLNSVEGGLSEYFSNFKSSDNLVDKLLIPTIEGKINQIHTKEDNSLSTMLISYAKQYVSRQSDIEKKKIYELFEQELSQLLPKANDLYNANDSLENGIRELFGFQNALNLKLTECKTNQEKCNTDLKNLEMQTHKIKHEQASAEFYNARDEFEKVNNYYLETEEQEKQLKEELKNKKHSKAVLECAEYYKKLLEVEGEIKGLQDRITMQESGTDFADELSSLKYTVFVQVCNLLNKHEPEAKQLKSKITDLQLQKQKTEKEITLVETDNKNARDNYISKKTTLKNTKDETDNQLSQSGIIATRQLDGTFEENLLNNIKAKKEIELNNLMEDKTKAEDEKKSIEFELNDIHPQLADLHIEREKYCSEKALTEKTLKDYYSKEEQIKGICSAYNLDFSARFTDNIISYLESELKSIRAKQAEIIRKISISDEEINAAKKGYLHVPSAVIDYLNSTGVIYSTCEKYLTEQVDSGKITAEECLEILQNYPAAAYAVLMETKEKEKFFSYGREKWLPAMIPLFTYEQMNQILQNNRKFDGSIAFYSEEFFADKTSYLEQLNTAHNNLLNSQELLIATEKELRTNLDIAKTFDFSENWESNQKENLGNLDNNIKKCDDKKSALENHQKTLSENNNILNQKIKEFEESIRNTEDILKKLDVVQSRIETEKSLVQEVYNAKSNYDETTKKLSLIKLLHDSLIHDIDDNNAELKKIENEIKQLSDIKNDIGECPESDLTDGEYTELYSRYQALQNKLTEQISELKQQLEGKKNHKTDLNKELNKRNLDSEEYKDTLYSQEQFDNIEESIKQSEIILDKISVKIKKYSEEKGRAEHRLEAAKTQLDAYGEPLDKSEIGTNFDNRINAISTEKEKISEIKNTYKSKEDYLNRILDRLKDRIITLDCPDTVPLVKLEESEKTQFDRLYNEYNNLKKKFHTLYEEIKNKLDEIKTQFDSSADGIGNAIGGMIKLLQNDKQGDRYYTLTEHIECAKENSKKVISKITTDLQGFESDRNNLIRQCVLQGERIFSGLSQMASSSRVKVYEGKKNVQMICFDIPSQVDSVVANASITDEIDKGTIELAEKLTDKSSTEADIKKSADKIVGSKNLLRKYISKESICVKAYKIDRNPHNAGHRTWEQTQVNNSGAEKFVVYFAVILALMNYTRSDVGEIRDKDLRSALILDNPFGATSSKHILVPMFSIAKHFNVQMICLSDINKSDVVNCFDINIKAIVKKIAMSNKEQLTHEGNETIEHGYYRSEQISIL